MSYLMLPNGPADFKKAIISFWFRVPQDTIDKVNKAAKDYFAAANAASDAGGFLPPPPFNGVIPLVVFGKQETNKSFTAHFVPGGTTNHTQHTFVLGAVCDWIITGTSTSEWSLFQYYQDGKFDYTVDPSYIGVDCKPTLDDNGDPTDEYIPRLSINLQMPDQASYTGSSWMNDVSADISDTNTWLGLGNSDFICTAPPVGTVLSEATDFVTVESAASIIYGSRPENFRTIAEHPVQAPFSGSFRFDDFLKGGQKVEPDTWHHVLISFDLSKKCLITGSIGEAGSSPPDGGGSVKSAPYLGVAFDDNNLTKTDLTQYWPANGGPNDFLTVQGYSIYRDFVAISDPSTTVSLGEKTTSGTFGVEVATYDYAPSQIKSYAFGIPATSTFVDNIYAVEMAEFLMFTDFEGDFDTSVGENRSLFITGKNHKGQQFPVNRSPIAIPINKLAIGDPATWEPGADIAAFVPGLVNPAFTPTAVKLPGASKPVTADIDFTKCSVNWIIGNNMGTLSKDKLNKPEKTGKIMAYFPDPVLKEAPGG